MKIIKNDKHDLLTNKQLKEYMVWHYVNIGHIYGPKSSLCSIVKVSIATIYVKMHVHFQLNLPHVRW
jgi:hypothetical protein